MDLRADLRPRVVQDTASQPWLPLPMAAVEGRMHDRLGSLVACAISLMRCAQRSRFECHHDGGGEEILLLEGVFTERAPHPTGRQLAAQSTREHAPALK